MSLYSLNTLLEEKKKWDIAGERVVFTNGVFDILHVGHLHCLESALAHGTRLVVGINSDSSVRRLDKAPNRPIHTEQDRAKIVSALTCVDAVIIFDTDTPLDLINDLSPHVLVKGGDYDPTCTDQSSSSYIVGSKEVRANGGSVESITLLTGHSTTDILKKKR